MVKYFNNINNNFKQSEMLYIKEFNKINKNINENNYDSESIIDEIDYLINKIKKVLPSNKSTMILILDIIKNNVEVNN
jgi:predicted phage-related endonuclease